MQQNGFKRLTPRELEVLKLLALGNPRERIAKNLTIAVRTVDQHIGNMLNKLNIHSQIELVAYAYKKCIVSSGRQTIFCPNCRAPLVLQAKGAINADSSTATR